MNDRDTLDERPDPVRWEETGWRTQALCAEVGPELFFPKRGNRASDARKVCFACPVRIECLEESLARREEYGIWGGVGRDERRKILQERGAA